MRRIALLSAVAGIALIAACSKAKDDVPAAPPPPPPPPPHQVTITLNCSGNSAGIDVHNWRVQVNKTDGVKWFAPQTAVWITPKDPAQWPFDTPRIDVPAGQPVTSTNFKSSVEPGTYKYIVSGVCGTGADQFTVELDPDMIIPTRIQK